jgi:predicted nuclease of predicted toxin-antitoxin system
MRFLANENYPLESVRRLRKAGHHVSAIIEDSPGATDEWVLPRAANEQLIVLTFDKDYGELLFKRRLPAPAGIVFYRFHPTTPDEPSNHLLKLLTISGIELEGKFTVVEREQVRQRPLS